MGVPKNEIREKEAFVLRWVALDLFYLDLNLRNRALELWVLCAYFDVCE